MTQTGHLLFYFNIFLFWNDDFSLAFFFIWYPASAMPLFAYVSNVILCLVYVLGLSSVLNPNIIQISLNCLTFNVDEGYSEQPCIYYDGREFAARCYLSFNFQVSILHLFHWSTNCNSIDYYLFRFDNSGNHLHARFNVVLNSSCTKRFWVPYAWNTVDITTSFSCACGIAREAILKLVSLL